MFEGVLAGLQELDVAVMAYIALGVIVSSTVSAFPGLGSAFTLVMLFPVAYALDDPLAAIALLTGAAVVSGTANTITSVLLGVPGSAVGVAVTFDGYPMSKRGEGGRAVAAGLTASLVGGIIGAFLMALLLPFVRPMVLALGSPEFFALIVVALVLIAYVQETTMVKGLASAGLGLMAAYVGQEASTATLRYTFGQIYLWDGLKLVPVIIGLFAISEMMELGRRGGTIAGDYNTSRGSVGGTLRGMLDVFRHWRVTITSAAVGWAVGLVPGLGSAAAQFFSYGQAARTSPNRETFGKGNVEGVIAADAVTNSKEGGALIPTLAFGIPGSGSMALLLIAYISFGITPGEAMLTTNIHVTWMIIWILVIANVMATVLSLTFARYIAKLTFVPVSRLIGPILVICLWGAYVTSNHVGDLIVAVGFGFFGYALKRCGFSRANFIIGLVLGAMLEQHYLLAMRVFGIAFLSRPITMGLFIALALSLLFPLLGRVIRSRRKRERDPRPTDDQSGEYSDQSETVQKS